MKRFPILTYNNSLLYKSLILKQNSKKSGIYRWINLINNKSYIGSAINLNDRLRRYYYNNNLKKILIREKSLIYVAILKHGLSNFKLEILEYCGINNLLSREQYYFDLLKPEYNICKKAGSRIGTKQSEKTKFIISVKNRGKKNPNFGKKHSKNILERIKKNNLNKKVSDETKLKLSLRSNGINVKIFDNLNNQVYQFSSIKSAAKHLNIGISTLNRIYENGKSYDNFIYKFEPKDLRILIYDSNKNLIDIIENAKKVSLKYDIPRSTLSNYIKSGKLYKKKFYFFLYSNIA